MKHKWVPSDPVLSIPGNIADAMKGGILCKLKQKVAPPRWWITGGAHVSHTEVSRNSVSLEVILGSNVCSEKKKDIWLTWLFKATRGVWEPHLHFTKLIKLVSLEQCHHKGVHHYTFPYVCDRIAPVTEDFNSGEDELQRSPVVALRSLKGSRS